MDGALRRGEAIVNHESMVAYREAQRLVYHRTPGVDRWVWVAVLDRRTCAICYSQHGRSFPTSGSLSSHVGCRCVMAPVEAGKASGVPSGEEAFARLGEDEQLRILGRGRLDLYRSGTPLSDMIGTSKHPTWGEHRRIIPLRDLEP
jgi:hypothetical protein